MMPCLRCCRLSPSSGSKSWGPLNMYMRLLCPKRNVSPTLVPCGVGRMTIDMYQSRVKQ